MGAFPSFVLRKRDTLAAGTFQAPSTHRLAGQAIGYPVEGDMDPRNLVIGGDGASRKYAAWSNGTTYTFSAAATASVVEYGGKQWVLHTTQPSGLGAFPGTAYWYELRPLLWWQTIWGDVRKSGAAASTAGIMTAWIAAGNPLRFHQYIYLPTAAGSGDHYGVAAAAWLDANNGWMSTDNAVLTSTTKSCGTTNGTNVVTCAITGGLTVGMDVRNAGSPGTGIQHRSRIGAITPDTSFTVLNSETGAAQNSTATNTYTLTFTNRSCQTSLFTATGGVNNYQTAIARILEFKDSNGDTFASWYATQVAGADATFSGFPIYGFATDDMVDTESQRTADGDFVNSNYSESQNYFGSGYHRSGAFEDSTAALAKAAIQAGMANAWHELRRGMPKAKVMSNSGQSKRPASGVWDKVPDTIYIEGCGGFYSPESQLMQVGWKQQLKMAQDLCSSVGRLRACPVVWHWKSYNDYDAPGTAANPKTQPFHKDMLFALCSTLLSDAAFSFGFQGGDLGSYSSEVCHRFYLAELDAPIGVRVGPMPDPAGDGSGIWWQETQAGLVAVRPKPDKATNSDWATDATVNFTLPFDVVELNGTLNPEDQGRTRLAGTTVPFATREGRIFLKP